VYYGPRKVNIICKKAELFLNGDGRACREAFLNRPKTDKIYWEIRTVPFGRFESVRDKNKVHATKVVILLRTEENSNYTKVHIGVRKDHLKLVNI